MNQREHSSDTTMRLARFVASTSFGDLPDEVISNAKLAMLDTFACAIAAAGLPVGTIVIEHVAETSPAPGLATIWPTGERTSAPIAAYVNGHLANALDYDLSLHLDTHALPAGLAVAEWRQVTGRTFLGAYLVAREVGARLMKALDGRRRDGVGVSHRGWWHAGLVGPLDSALVSARLLELDELQTARALGIASASVGGFRRSLGTMTKSLHSGLGARDGVDAALLARRGFTGDPQILEAPMGLIDALCPDGDFDHEALFDGLGTSFELQVPPKTKPFPACGPSQAQIDSTTQLLRENDFAPMDITRVVVNFHPHSLFRPEAEDEIEAGFSTPYIISATLIDGDFGLRQIAPARVQDPDIRLLMTRFEHDPHAAHREVVVHLRDGRVLRAEAPARRSLRSWREIEAKFDDAAEGRFRPSATAEFKERLQDLESLDNVALLLEALGEATGT